MEPLVRSFNWKRGVLLILASWLFFTTMVALARDLHETVSVPMILLFQNLLSIPLIAPMMWSEGKESFKLPDLKLLSIRFIAGYLNFALIFWAVHYASIVNVLLLSNSAPLLIPLIIWAWRGIRISFKLWLGIIVGFCGIAIILQPSKTLDNFGDLLALCAALCFAISMIVQRRLVKKSHSHTILFYYYLLGILVSLPLAIATWHPLDSTLFFKLILLGLLSGIGQLFFLKALKYERPSFLSPFNYSSVVYAVLINLLIWNKVPSSLEIIGIIVVCTGAILTTVSAIKNPET